MSSRQGFFKVRRRPRTSYVHSQDKSLDSLLTRERKETSSSTSKFTFDKVRKSVRRAVSGVFSAHSFDDNPKVFTNSVASRRFDVYPNTKLLMQHGCSPSILDPSRLELFSEHAALSYATTCAVTVNDANPVQGRTFSIADGTISVFDQEMETEESINVHNITEIRYLGQHSHYLWIKAFRENECHSEKQDKFCFHFLSNNETKRCLEFILLEIERISFAITKLLDAYSVFGADDRDATNQTEEHLECLMRKRFHLYCLCKPKDHWMIESSKQELQDFLNVVYPKLENIDLAASSPRDRIQVDSPYAAFSQDSEGNIPGAKLQTAIEKSECTTELSLLKLELASRLAATASTPKFYTP